MNQEIKPTYVTFEQAQWLKDKGFECESDYNQWILSKDKDDDSKKFICHSDELESYTYIDEDTEHNVYHCLSLPEQWQVIEWLRVNHDIHVTYDIGLTGCYGLIQYRHSKGSLYLSKWVNEQENPFSSPQEAYSAAFDYIKDNNLI
jgi:hypothetical protein